MIIEILGNGLISLIEMGLLYLFVGLFMQKRDLSKTIRLLSFLVIMLIYSILTVFKIETSTFKIPIFLLLHVLFCFILFRDNKWSKYVVYTCLFYILEIIVEALFISILNIFTNFDAAQASTTYDLSAFVIILIMRLFILIAVLFIRSLMGRSIQKKQWQIFLLMPLLTIVFVWLVYRRYWGMGNPDIDKLLTYVGIFLVIQNAFVFFYIISLQSSTNQYLEIKAAYDRQKQYSSTINAVQRAVRKMAHDIRHHFIYLMSALEQEDIPKAKDYLTKLDENLDNMVPLNVTGHYDVDALLHAKARIAEKLNIHIRVEGALPPELMISPIDLSALFGNSIDNAIEAASGVDGHKEITVSFGYNASRLNFIISNPYTGQIQKKANGYFASRKANGGLGIEIIDEVVKKYNGALLTEIDNNKFTLTAMLQTQNPV